MSSNRHLVTGKKLFMASLVAVLLGACSGEELYRGLGEREANEMMGVLLEAAIVVQKERGENGTFSLRLAKADIAPAVRLLSSAGYPREQVKTVDDMFPAGKLVQTQFEQRARLGFALSQELARSIATIQGVSSARVHLALAQQDFRGRVLTPASSSIIIRYADGASLAEISLQARMIVASGVEGMAVENVKVILSPQDSVAARMPDLPTQRPSAAASNNGLASRLPPVDSAHLNSVPRK